MRKPANTPAFPSNEITDDFDKRNMIQYAGISKREYFAAMALQGLCAATGVQLQGHPKEYGLHTQAVQLADALLAELEK